MSRTIRKECGRRGIPHLEVLYSSEGPVRPSAVAGSSHGGLSNLGTASYMPPIMGQMVAGRVIRALIGYEPWRWDKESGTGDIARETKPEPATAAAATTGGDIARETKPEPATAAAATTGGGIASETE